MEDFCGNDKYGKRNLVEKRFQGEFGMVLMCV